jgi:hypothetical protein
MFSGRAVYVIAPLQVLVIYPEGIKTLIRAFEGFEVERRMEGVVEK